MTDRTILHCDMNNFYASVECLYNPALRGKPVAVGGDVEARHGIILAKNYEAKKYGVQTGEALWQAKQKCPGLTIVPPSFDKYLRFSRLAREIYGCYTDRIESFGLDECWLDLTGSERLFGDGKAVADRLRERIKFELGVTISVGVSYNKIFSKLGSDMKKPDATTVITRENYKNVVWPLPVSDLLFVGPATTRKLARYGVHTIGQLAQADGEWLGRRLGKNGRTLYAFANGLDCSPVVANDAVSVIKSVGNSITAPHDLVTDEDVKLTLFILAESVAARLREQGLRCTTVQISIRDNELFRYERQGKLDAPTSATRPIADKAYALYKQHHTSSKPIRSLGVRGTGLVTQDNVQLSFLAEAVKIQKQNDLESAIDGIRSRFGHSAVLRGIVLTDSAMAHIDPKGGHVIHPEPFGW
ncbi:MAG TPA: DNA polymerase IV [Candidatus Aphodoplasma excrementigallinarum]|uniref:DNA polymerase IV n=1 Tax=Candidatus Aphodoplasma excrementigallinarum TaxID=2840673 RepID=A0A9D1NHI1_9FIRM|nr:DNA polymerase IV [Candidatus Aphodoplasma excrementigallinarum]